MNTHRWKHLLKQRLKEKYGVGFLISFGCHSILIVLLGMSIHSTTRPSTSLPNPTEHIVQATVVDEKQVSTEIKRIQAQETQKKLEEQKKIETLERATQEAEKEQKKVAQLKQALEKTRQAEHDQLTAIRLAKEKERKELENIKKAKEKELKRLTALDERRQEEQDRARQMRLEREKEEKRQAKLQAEEEARAAALDAQEAERRAVLDAQQQRRLSAEIDQHTAMIKEKINQSWIRSPGMPEGLSCVLEIETFPDGNVKRVKVTEPSENEAFNQSAEAAVLKATPLPMPQGEVSDRFRHFELTFSPKS